MIDISCERPISLNAAAKFLPDGRRPSFTTFWRWSTRGIRGVKLETLLVGGQRCTTAEAVLRFIAETTAVANGEPTPQRTTRQRAAAIKQAERDCQRAGI